MNLVFPGHVVIFGTDTDIHLTECKVSGGNIQNLMQFGIFDFHFLVPMTVYNFAQWACHLDSVGCDLGHKICCTIFTIQSNFMSNTE